MLNSLLYSLVEIILFAKKKRKKKGGVVWQLRKVSEVRSNTGSQFQQPPPFGNNGRQACSAGHGTGQPWDWEAGQDL